MSGGGFDTSISESLALDITLQGVLQIHFEVKDNTVEIAAMLFL